MPITNNLQPQRVLAYFEELCAIPHGSGNTKQISDYCVDFAKRHGLAYQQDAMNNIIIRKPAAAGYEEHPPVIIQGHLDMVCEKKEDKVFDFTIDPICLQLEGDWLTADGTTLGGDDGIAVAMALAILEDPALPHPPLEVVFTVDEEIGLLGAIELDTATLQGRTLLNIDSEEEGILTVGCAGGARVDISLPLPFAATSMPCYQINLSGLLGGHSGVEIDKGRQNANILLGQLLHSLPFAWRLVSIDGGQKDNAIPRQAVCVIAADQDPAPAAAAFLQKNRVDTDPDLAITVTPIPAAPMAAEESASRTVAAFLATVKNGVQAMSQALTGLVETSLNCGITKIQDNAFHAVFSVRSAITKDKRALLDDLRAAAEHIGAAYEESGHYPAWEYVADSPLQKTMTAVFEQQYGYTPRITAIHGGLECGVFSEKLAGLDAVSFGPDIPNIHTTEERLSLPSTARTYAYLLAVLEAL